MRRDVLDALAIDIDLAPIAQRLEEFRAGKGTLPAFEDVFGVLGHGRDPFFLWLPSMHGFCNAARWSSHVDRQRRVRLGWHRRPYARCRPPRGNPMPRTARGLHYEVTDLRAPWLRERQTGRPVVLHHGVGASLGIFAEWMPIVAARHPVARF